jgi:hypothetical protein
MQNNLVENYKTAHVKKNSICRYKHSDWLFFSCLLRSVTTNGTYVTKFQKISVNAKINYWG